ncbi:MAG: DNA repair protein RecO [Chlorobium sp.]|nr:DNA repair protein RecO [Chlorobium phaeovibrioides]NQU46259.1 DNA repair protein RecO [Chlorobium sp.]
MIVKTRAVVLREIKYRDQSKLCTLFTREFGKLTVILKGGRNPKSRLAGIFTAGNLLDCVIYRKAERDVQLLSDASLLACPMVPEADMERFGALYRMIDLVNRTTERDEKNLPLFTLLETALREICRERGNFPLLYAWFLLRFISILGFEPELRQCIFSGCDLRESLQERPAEGLLFIMNPGGLALPGSLPSGTSNARSLTAEAAALLLSLSTMRPTVPAETHAAPADTESLSALLQDYSSLHLEHSANGRNRSIVSQILMK